MENMRIWDAVSKTDPGHTKPVNQRGGFTAIDAQYQIMEATRQFGPVGIGWGYDTGAPIFEGGAVIVPVTMWHGDRANRFGPIYGCASFTGGRMDTDAPKKATTDAITKGLSQLGFNADVFLGKFDDNKYVAELKREKEESTPPKPESYVVSGDSARDYADKVKLRMRGKGAEVAACVLQANDQWIATLPEPMRAEIKTAAGAEGAKVRAAA